MNLAGWRASDRRSAENGYGVHPQRPSRDTMAQAGGPRLSGQSVNDVSKEWSKTAALCLHEKLDEAFFIGKARVLRPGEARGVSDAVEKLNQKKVFCPEEHCVVFSESAKRFFLLYRNCSQAAILQKLPWVEADPCQAGMQAQPSVPRPSLGSEAGVSDAVEASQGSWKVIAAKINVLDCDLVRIFSKFEVKQDIYVQLHRKMEDGQQTLVGRTDECKDGNKNPRWDNEQFFFKRNPGNNQLKITVMARKRAWKDTVCGEAFVDLLPIWSNAEQNVAQLGAGVVLKLDLKLKKKGEVTGAIRLSLEPKVPASASAPLPPASVSVPQQPPAPGEPLVRKSARAGTGQPRPSKLMSENIKHLLNRPEEMKDKVQEVFLRVAKPNKEAGGQPMLEMEDMDTLGTVLAQELQVSMGVFGDLQVLFWRYDFDCDNFINLVEGIKMIESLIRRYRDAVSPAVGKLQLGEGVPHRNIKDGYELGKELGRGGQAIVHLATQNGTGRQVVLKMYAKNCPDMPVEDITAEFELIIKLKHPKIARYFEIFQDTSNFYIVSEPLFGGDLTQLVAKAHETGVQVTEKWLARIILQIAQGVSFLHGHYIMHCDLKEANVMVADSSRYESPQVVVIDFGLANHLSSLTAGGGSPGYMPPEVWQTGLWTPRGDVFSLGCIVYSLCYGNSPFLDGCRSIDDVRERTLTVEPKLNFGSQSMRDLVEGMLQKLLTDRPSIRKVHDSPWFKEQVKQDGDILQKSVLMKFDQKGRQTKLRRALLCDVAQRENLAQLHDLNDLFSKLDTDNDGVLQSAEVRMALSTHGWNSADIDRLLEALVGESEEVSYEEFMVQLMTSTANEEGELLERIFNEADSNHRGQLNVDDIQSLLNKDAVKKLLGKRSAETMLQEMDQDGNGLVSLEEFKLAMHGVPKEFRSIAPGTQTMRIATIARVRPKAQQQVYRVGQAIEYYSTTYNDWLPGLVEAYDEASGSIQVDNKPGWWLKGADLKKVRPKSATGGYDCASIQKAALGRQALHGGLMK